jgi:hypothetical protein
MKKFIISESEKNNILNMYGILSEQTLDTVDKVKSFQDWMDKNHPNWVNGRSLNKGGGYGNFGQYTSKAWNSYGNEYNSKVKNTTQPQQKEDLSKQVTLSAPVTITAGQDPTLSINKTFKDYIRQSLTDPDYSDTPNSNYKVNNFRFYVEGNKVTPQLTVIPFSGTPQIPAFKTFSVVFNPKGKPAQSLQNSLGANSGSQAIENNGGKGEVTINNVPYEYHLIGLKA